MDREGRLKRFVVAMAELEMALEDLAEGDLPSLATETLQVTPVMIKALDALGLPVDLVHNLPTLIEVLT